MRTENTNTGVWIWRVMRGLAVICFLAAVFVAMGWASIDHHEGLVPGGLFLWCASTVW